MLRPHQQEKLKWPDWAVSGSYNGWSNKLKLLSSHPPLIFTQFQSLCLSPTLPTQLHSMTHWRMSTHTHTHNSHTTTLSKSCESSTQLSTHLSPPFTVLFFFFFFLPVWHHEPAEGTSRRGDTANTESHESHSHCRAVSHLDMHTHTVHPHTWTMVVYISHSLTYMKPHAGEAQWQHVTVLVRASVHAEHSLTCCPETFLPVRVAWRTTSRSAQSLYPSNTCSREKEQGRKKIIRQRKTQIENGFTSLYSFFSLSLYTGAWLIKSNIWTMSHSSAQESCNT